MLSCKLVVPHRRSRGSPRRGEGSIGEYQTQEGNFLEIKARPIREKKKVTILYPISLSPTPLHMHPPLASRFFPHPFCKGVLLFETTEPRKFFIIDVERAELRFAPITGMFEKVRVEVREREKLRTS